MFRIFSETQDKYLGSKRSERGLREKLKLDLAFNNVKPKDWYFVLD